MINISIKKFLELIPDYVIEIAEELQSNGFEAFLVGGTLRDVLLERAPSDFDIATNAYPEQITAIFPRSIPTGAQFGTITVVGESKTGERFDVEVTTYRSEADYVGGRWPSKVEFTKTIQEDLSRRDFTINALALNLQKLDEVDPESGSESLLHQVIVDPFNGIADLQSKLLRAVGNPVERFREDGLRPVRGCRLAAQLGFAIEPQTLDAMSETNEVTAQVSVERFRDELMKLLLKASKPSVGLRLMSEVGILKLFIPELEEGKQVEQPQFHVEDVFSHILSTVDKAEDDIKLAALFHDIAKPRTFSEDEKGVHFYGHDVMGAEMTAEIMRRLKFSTAEINRTAKLVRWHMFFYPSADWRNLRKGEFDWTQATKDEIVQHLEETRTKTSKGGWSDGAIRRLIQNVGGEDNIEALMKLRIADATANPKSEFNPEEIAVLSQRIAEVRAKEMALKVTDLNIKGGMLMQAFGIEPGPVLGELLAYLLDQVVEDPSLNTEEQLLQLAKDHLDARG